MFALLQLPFSVIDRSFSTSELGPGLGQKVNVHISADHRFEFAFDEGGEPSTHRDPDRRAVAIPSRPESL
jgi:hypothetical protein